MIISVFKVHHMCSLTMLIFCILDIEKQYLYLIFIRVKNTVKNDKYIYYIYTLISAKIINNVIDFSPFLTTIRPFHLLHTLIILLVQLP